MYETQTQQTPMTALQGFNLLAKDVLPKLIKRIAACESATNINQNGVAEAVAYQAAARALEDKLQDILARIHNDAEMLRAELITRMDDTHKRLEELERAKEEQEAKNAAKAKRLRKKKPVVAGDTPAETADPSPATAPEPVASAEEVTEEQIADALISASQEDTQLAQAVEQQGEPPVILEDPVADPAQDLAEAMNFASQMPQPQPQPVQPEPQVVQPAFDRDAMNRQIVSIVRAGAASAEQVAQRFNVTIEYVQSLLSGGVNA